MQKRVTFFPFNKIDSLLKSKDILLFSMLITFIMWSCETDNSGTNRWHLVRYYGTEAGISKTFERDICVWTIGDSTLSIDMKTEDPIIKSVSSQHRFVGTGSIKYWQIDGLGDFIRRESGDTMYLLAPCCDMIDYTLVKD